MVVRRYINFLILLIATPLVSVLFNSSIPTFCSFFKLQRSMPNRDFLLRAVRTYTCDIIPYSIAN